MELPKALQVLYHSVIVVSRSALLWGLHAFITRNMWGWYSLDTCSIHVCLVTEKMRNVWGKKIHRQSICRHEVIFLFLWFCLVTVTIDQNRVLSKAMWRETPSYRIRRYLSVQKSRLRQGEIAVKEENRRYYLHKLYLEQ